jgi:hypothetical protein
MADRNEEQSLCVYCGIVPATTMDHVVPKCLFVPPLPSDMVTVPACKGCNQKKALNDPFLRDLLVMDLQCADFPIAKGLRTGKVMRAAKKNRSEVVRSIVKNARPKPMYTNGGLYLGHYPSIPLDGDRMDEIFQTIVRGLYYKLRLIRLPDNCVFEISRVDPLHIQEAIRDMEGIKAVGPLRIGEVFRCYVTYAIDNDHTTAWLLGFMGGFFLHVLTQTANEEKIVRR